MDELVECGRCHATIPNLIGCVVCGNGIAPEYQCVPISEVQQKFKARMTPAQYAEFMAKHAKAGQRTNKRRAFFRGSK